MIANTYHLLARLIRLLPKTTNVAFGGMKARFLVPIQNHYVCDDLVKIKASKREPELYEWLDNIPDGSVFFDVGTSYGQESSLLSSKKEVKVFGFDCSLYHSHFCAMNRILNDSRYQFIFAAIGERSGDMVTIKANSDIHIPDLHKKNVPYEYQLLTLSLDDFSKQNNIKPTHLKIDVDGAEVGVLKGAKTILNSKHIQEIFIEIDNHSQYVFDLIKSYGFKVKWRIDRPQNCDVLFVRNS